VDPASGALTPVPGSPFSAGRHPIWPAIDPGGHCILVANRDSDTVSAWRIDPRTGELVPMTGSPYPTGKRPRAVTISPSGRFAYLANEGSGSISGYRLAEEGRLLPIQGSPFTW
jgi:6-phosphogluconolactonase